MKNYFKILVATDYSANAENAELYAINMAKSTESVITFFHVYNKGIGLPNEFRELEKTDESPDEFEESKLQQHTERMFEASSAAPEDIEHSYKVGEGNVAREIIKAAKEEGADFIVVGTHGGNAAHEKLFGGHTWDIIRHSSVPVLAIPKEASYSDISKIVFATEYRQSEIPLIKYLSGFAGWFDAEMIVLHITSNVFSPEFDHEMFERFRKEVLTVVSYDKLSIRLVKNGTLIEGLNKYCTRTKAQWLVMSHEKTSFLVSIFNPISTTKRMSIQTHIPLFAVPDGYKPAEMKDLKKPKREIKYDDFFG